MRTLILELPDQASAALQKAAAKEATSEQLIILNLIERDLTPALSGSQAADLPGTKLLSYIPTEGSGISDLGFNPAHLAGYGKG